MSIISFDVPGSGYLDGSERPSNQQMDWKKLCTTSLAGNLQLAKINDSFEVAIWGNSMGSIQEVLERGQVLRNIKPSEAANCPTKTCSFQVDESAHVQLLSQETPQIPSYRGKR